MHGCVHCYVRLWNGFVMNEIALCAISNWWSMAVSFWWMKVNSESTYWMCWVKMNSSALILHICLHALLQGWTEIICAQFEVHLCMNKYQYMCNLGIHVTEYIWILTDWCLSASTVLRPTCRNNLGIHIWILIDCDCFLRTHRKQIEHLNNWILTDSNCMLMHWQNTYIQWTFPLNSNQYNSIFAQAYMKWPHIDSNWILGGTSVLLHKHRIIVFVPVHI